MTTEGVDAMQKELYTFPDAMLQDQADQITNDFRGWLIENFTLDDKQVNYLSGLEDNFISYCGSVTGTAVRARLPIGLDYPSPPSRPFSSKYIKVDNNVTLPDPSHPESATGSLSFLITYILS